MLSHLSPPRRRMVVGLIGLVVATCLGLVAYGLVDSSRGGDAVSQRDPGPILLVPGYGGSTGSLEPLAEALRRTDRDVTVVQLPGDGTGDLGVQADAVQEAALAAMDRTGASSVDVVGYSAGGVVARLWVRGDGDELARRVVTLGSPHHGADIAALAAGVLPSACPPACSQLAPGSALLRSLNAGDETPDGPAWVSVWTERDEIVTPASSAELDGALNVAMQTVCPGSTLRHGDLPDDPSVQAIIEAALDVAAPHVPLSLPCAVSW